MAETIIARGVIVRAPGDPGTIEEFTIDPPHPGEALVRIVASGVCHSDLHYRDNLMGNTRYPLLLGHEGSGIVEQVGEGVTNVKPGDSVILSWRAPCGACRFCTTNRPEHCVARLNAHQGMRALDGEALTPVLGIGTFCTRTLVHAEQCIPVDAALPPEQMSLIGCGVMTGVGAAMHTANVQPGQSVAVIGCGGVGISVIMGARLAGATTIIAVDVQQSKLDWAREFGATHTVNPSDGDAVANIRMITGGFGVDASFEAVGRPETLQTALYCRDSAGTCVLIGLPGQEATLHVSLMEFFIRGGSLRVSKYGDCVPVRDFPKLAEWYAQGDLDLDRLVTRIITLEETEDAFRAMKQGETLRSVIRLEA